MRKPNNASGATMPNTKCLRLSSRPRSLPFAFVSWTSEPSCICDVFFYDLFILVPFICSFINSFFSSIHYCLFYRCALYLSFSQVSACVSEFSLLPHAANTVCYVKFTDQPCCKSLTICSNGSVSEGLCHLVCGLLCNGIPPVSSHGDNGPLPGRCLLPYL